MENNKVASVNVTVDVGKFQRKGKEWSLVGGRRKNQLNRVEQFNGAIRREKKWNITSC